MPVAIVEREGEDGTEYAVLEYRVKRSKLAFYGEDVAVKEVLVTSDWNAASTRRDSILAREAARTEAAPRNQEPTKARKRVSNVNPQTIKVQHERKHVPATSRGGRGRTEPGEIRYVGRHKRSR